ncbi:hypothetical protein K3495_g1683 [Podosphaera aphanis]|nr:hypothetical protein K3495_g1683 [Podosphaera aphanis]
MPFWVDRQLVLHPGFQASFSNFSEDNGEVSAFEFDSDETETVEDSEDAYLIAEDDDDDDDDEAINFANTKAMMLKVIEICEQQNALGSTKFAILMGLRAALPVVRTTPNVALHREAGIPQAKILLEGNTIRVAARLKSLDKQHPLRSRASVCPNMGTQKYKKKKKGSARPELQMSRVQRAYQQLPESEVPDSIPTPAYNAALNTKETEIEAYIRWANDVPGRDICAFADGSSEGHSRSTWGFVLKREGRTLLQGSGIVHGGEVLDAEILGAKNALESALRFIREEQQRLSERKQHIHVFLDIQKAVKY